MPADHPAQHVAPVHSRLAGLGLLKLKLAPKAGSSADVAGAKTVAEMETELYERLVARDKAKKVVAGQKRRRLTSKTKESDALATKDSDGLDTAVVKKPAAADASVAPATVAAKRVKPSPPVAKSAPPAAADVPSPDAKYVVVWKPGSKNRRTFQCNHYKKAKKHARDLKLPDADVSSRGTAAYAEAGAMWDDEIAAEDID